MKTYRIGRLTAGILLSFLLMLLTVGCAQSAAGDPIAKVSGDFDAEITWSFPAAESETAKGETRVQYAAGVRARDGLLSLSFTSPESMAGIEVRELAGGGAEIRRNGTVLTGTAYARYLKAARLLTKTGPISERTTEPDGITLTYLVTLPDGSTRTRTMSLDGKGTPISVTEPEYTTVHVVWFEAAE